MGRLDEAHEIVARLRAITPLIVPSDLPWRDPEDRSSSQWTPSWRKQSRANSSLFKIPC
jgi:hypothetical protein